MSRLTRHKPTCAAAACALLAALVAAGTASASDPSTTGSGGAVFTPPPPLPKKAKIWHGRAIAPLSAPPRVKAVISAANRLIHKPYRWGGGHTATMSRLDSGYDCSGSVSYALYGGRFVRYALDSSGLMRWGRRGPGRWMTVYANGGHAYMVVAGLRFDTSMHDRGAPLPATGPRWSRKLRRSSSFVPRHPGGY